MSLVEAWISGTIASAIVFSPFLLLLAVLLWRSGVWERRVIREELAGEVGGAVSPAECDAVRRDGIFRMRRILPARPVISRAIVNAQQELAFRKRRARDEERDPEADALVQARRAEIALLRELA